MVRGAFMRSSIFLGRVWCAPPPDNRCAPLLRLVGGVILRITLAVLPVTSSAEVQNGAGYVGRGG